MRWQLFGALACGALGLRPDVRNGRALPSRRDMLSGMLPLTATLLLPSAAHASDNRGFVLAQPDRDTGLQAKWLEKLRIILQDEADATQYGGELAPGSPPSSTPLLLLVPIVQIQRTLNGVAPLLKDFGEWPRVQLLLSTGPFATTEFKRIFNAFSDNIYYVSGSSEANAYLLGGATPSSLQTKQYLLRNEVLKQVNELVDEIVYQLKLPDDQRETEVAEEYLEKAQKYLAEYLALAPPDEFAAAREAVYGGGSKLGR